ncbi:microtubule-associated proteins 65-1 [Arabidopsis thaliana]|uniref:Microtubule-associated proteins 65-1 n=1 Tax=Arabidopsis thaliana TaxID=3702 RepID=F4K3E4_ARATH|nr:microtubule-associated proteins 65-1 [Arabidopsis thaliana]AED96603.1 microtubule-associated proteins 65-1 [Arabidopsis thaliana]|eukprot:NP_001190542.1 microtubule-associated proteins 65-1 [Arabidopsis thaliana]
MAVTDTESPHLGEITCGTLLEKLQEIWDEVGESDDERDKLLLQIEQECLDVYKRKVEQAAKSRAELLQTLSDANAELSSLTMSLGDKSLVGIPDKSSGTIKEQLAAIAPALEQLWQQKEERVREFSDVQSQIQKICGDIAGGLSNEVPIVDESDLSLKKLDDFQSQLQELQKEKSDRLRKVLEFVSTVHDLCAVLGLDFLSTVTEVHPSLDEDTSVQSKSISNETLSRLAKTVLTLKDDKKQRLQKLQELATQLIDLWNLMDTPDEERELFDHVTCNISSSVDEVTVPGALARDLIEQVIYIALINLPMSSLRNQLLLANIHVKFVKAEVEVDRLDQLKASRMKEIAFKKQSELEEIYARAHVEVNPESARERIMSLIDSGNVEPTELLADMDSQISKAKEEAFSRKDILDRVEKWMSACEEESWLEDYNRDQNRYSASRGAHLNLKRAEKARILVSKIPAMVDTLVAKTRAWEEEHSMSFAYDGVPLLAMLDEYGMLRQEREEEKRRLREQKKVQEQPHVEQESAFSTRPSPARPVSAKKTVGPRANNGGANGTHNRRLSLNANQNGSRSTAKEAGRRETLNRPAAPTNYVAISKEEAASSPVSGAADHQVPASP